MASTSTERVLVVPAVRLDELGRFQGFSRESERYLAELLAEGVGAFRPRSEVEDDPTLKQMIPYVAFRCRDRLFCYTRGGGQGETRLHRLRSLGVGGHVAEEDASGGATLAAFEEALRRELSEEVEVRSPGRLRRVGLINDDATAVGRVHLGVAYVYELESPQVRPREDGLADAGFVPLGTVIALRDEFESWSQIFLDGFLAAGGR
ncbi:MAG: phosphoesterase [Isosphaeraceae bacterium]|nr:MAG: phosphoesterase [Isosphaeraceae bacterium]